MELFFFLIAALLLLNAGGAVAQLERTGTPNDTLKSVQIQPNGNVILNIYAPEAKT